MSRTLLAGRRVGDVLLDQPLLLAERRVVLGDHERQPGGREVRGGVDELEVAELRPPELRPALAGGREPQHVGVAELLLRIAQRPRHRLPDCDHERRAHDRGRLLGRVGPVGLEVQQPPPQRGGGRPRDRLELALGDPRLGVARRGVDALDEHRLAAHLVALAVELLDQRQQQLLLLRGVGEADLDRAGGRLRGGRRLGRGLVLVALPAGEPRDRADRDGRHHSEQELTALHAVNVTDRG